jgi:hypothetical protein
VPLQSGNARRSRPAGIGSDDLDVAGDVGDTVRDVLHLHIIQCAPLGSGGCAQLPSPFRMAVG